jgi:hypothetical protein
LDINERKTIYRQWRETGDLTGTAMHFAAFTAPGWSREEHQAGYVAESGYADHQNAAALRELTRGEGDQFLPAARICTGCDREVYGDLVPWSGERLCWDCTDLQLDLLAAALLEDSPAEPKVRAS